jgi:hypothetical protein
MVLTLLLTVPVISFFPGTPKQAPLHPHLRAELLSSIKPVNEDLSPVILITGNSI